MATCDTLIAKKVRILSSMQKVNFYTGGQTWTTAQRNYQKIEKSCSKHKELEEEISKILLRAGQPEKEPGVMVSTFSWMTTGVKMMTGEDENKQAVKIIMNGCNMGTQSITEAMHQCKDASSESISIAKKLIGMEENLRDDMQKYL